MNPTIRRVALLVLVVALALALRLLVWQWREFYPLGGDEQEYLQQALTLLQEHRYIELRLMRPPLYGVFLAGSIYLFDSLVQQLRLVQAVISAATVVPIWLLTAELRQRYARPDTLTAAPLLAALLGALSYTLAAYATELLTETVFLFGLTVLFWLLTRASVPGGQRLLSAAAAGAVLGALCLTRSVALVLIPLGALWLLAAQWSTGAQMRRRWLPAGLLVLLALLVLLPWTARNYATYGGLIVVDTTGAENLWLDNDPAGREAVKAQLYALGDDRLQRQQLATQRGMAAITNDPARFADKAWGELLAFFALEYSDDLRARPEIWVPPAEVAARLVLGDGLWLLLLLTGIVGFCIVRHAPPEQPRRWLAALADPRWLLGAWAAYTLLTALVFHVELRYRLPLWPVLLPYAAFALVQAAQWARGNRQAAPGRWRLAAGGTVAALVLLLMLLHRPYPALAWHLGWKHWHLAQAERSLEREHPDAAAEAAQAALAHDDDSVLARVALAQVAQQQGETGAAEAHLRAAIEQLPAHPLPHLLLGDLLRQQGESAAALTHLAYEQNSLQDLQAWAWQRFETPPPAVLDVGSGHDLGHVRGFHFAQAADGTDWRWTTDTAYLRLAAPTTPEPEAAQHCPQPDAAALLVLHLAASRPPAAPLPEIRVVMNGQPIETLRVANAWQEYTLPLPAAALGAESAPLVVELRSDTFRPRTYDRTSDDGRVLGVMIESARIVPCSTLSSRGIVVY